MIRQYIRNAANLPIYKVDFYSGFQRIVNRNFHNYWDLWMSYVPHKHENSRHKCLNFMTERRSKKDIDANLYYD